MPWRAPQKKPENYEWDRVEKYPQHLNSNTIPPILELNKEFKFQAVSFVVSDNKIRRLAILRREAFEEVHQAAGVPCKCFCRRRFTTWDILLSTTEQMAKLTGGNLMTRNYKLEPEYMGTRRIQITVCNVSTDLSGDILDERWFSRERIADWTSRRETTPKLQLSK